MPDLKLKRLTVRNWMRLNDAVIDFPDSGLILLVGVNTASKGSFQSIGSGKTSVGEAICRTLLGTTGRFQHYKSCSTDRAGNTYVCVEADHRGESLVVESGFKCDELGGTGEALRYRYGDGNHIQRATIAETRNELAAIVGVTPTLAEWTVFVDGEKLEFNKMSQEDSVGLLMAALAQPAWPNYFKQAGKVVTNFEQSTLTAENAHASTAQRIEALTAEVKEAEASVTDATNVYNDLVRRHEATVKACEEANAKRVAGIELAQAEQKKIEAEMKQIEETSAVDHHQLEIARNEIADKLHAKQEEKTPAVEASATARAAWRTEEEKLNDMLDTPTTCSVCKKPWDTVYSEQAIKAQQAKVAKAEKAYRAKQAAVQAVDTALGAIRLEQQNAAKKMATLGAQSKTTALSQQWADLDTMIEETERAHQATALRLEGLKAGVSDAEVQSAKAVLAERQRTIKAARAELAKQATELAESKEALKIVQYWHRAFNSTGIPNMILSEAIEPLNHHAEAVSRRMTGGTVKVKFSTEKELTSGKSKARLVINVSNDLGSQEIQGNSKGESGLSNFIIAESLSEVGRVSNRIGFRWYDEIVPNQDAVVAKTIYTYLRETAQRLGIQLFLVEHDPAAANYADYILEVEKVSKDRSVVRWR
jgi:DNA repair exonuclease SbcCD ATPase subunit